MATTFKALGNNDVVFNRTLLHESIPITGSILEGHPNKTYVDAGTSTAIKTYSHGMFQSVYDYPYLSSSANHLFDLAVCYSNNSPISSSSRTHNAKKINMYTSLAQVLMGHESSGTSTTGVIRKVRDFDEDGDLTGGTKITDAFVINLARLLTKDEIKKGSFNLELGVNDGFGQPFRKRVALKDTGANDNFFVNSPAGEYGILYATNTTGSALVNPTGGTTSVKAGLIFYQAGVAVISGSIFDATANVASIGTDGHLSASADLLSAKTFEHGNAFEAMLTGTTINNCATAIRRRIYNLSFNNTTELHSTIYFCRLHNNDFNYSTNPTYISGSKLKVKTNATDMPVSYLTTVGLYGANNELLAVAKLSEPLKKTPQNEITLRVRLDY